MIPTMILFGLVLGRWWLPCIVSAAVVWTSLVLAAGGLSWDPGLLGVAGLGIANAAVGVAVHQGLLALVRGARKPRAAA